MLPAELAPSYILVNVAGFELDVVEAYRSILQMRVVVGQEATRTRRAFSHGCIRLEKPLELARLILQRSGSLTRRSR